MDVPSFSIEKSRILPQGVSRLRYTASKKYQNNRQAAMMSGVEKPAIQVIRTSAVAMMTVMMIARSDFCGAEGVGNSFIQASCLK